MPRSAGERPIDESMTVVLRLQRQLDQSSILKPKAKLVVKESLGVVLAELQAASLNAAPKRKR